MDETQKKIVRYLLKNSYNSGFNSYPLKPIAEELNITVDEIYDENTNTGIMWEYGDYGNGFLSFRNGFASVCFDTKDLLENWSEFRYIG